MRFSRMQANADGRFCSGCSKTVYDLSAKSPEEMSAFFNEKGTNVCVSVLTTQINQPPATSWFKIKFAAAVLLAFFGFQMKPMAQEVRNKADHPVVYKRDKDQHLNELKCKPETKPFKRRFTPFRKKKRVTGRFIGCPSF